jgi:autotransporter translocation and assembly factor TamB
MNHTKRKEKVKKYSNRILLVLCTFFFILSLTTLIPLDHLLKTRLEIFLSRQIMDYETTIGHLSTRPFGTIQLKDIRIGSAKNKEAIPIFYVESITIKLCMPDLIHFQVCMHSLAIQGMHIQLLQNSTGVFSFPSSQPFNTKTLSGGEIQVKLNQITMENSSIHYSDKSLPLNGSANDLSIHINHQGEDKYRFQLISDSITTHLNDMHFSRNSVSVSGIWSSSQLRLDSIRADLSGQKVFGSAGIFFSETADSLWGQFQISGNPCFFPDALFKNLPEHLLPLYGDINTSIKLGGSIEYPIIQTKIDIPLLTAGDHEINECRIQMEWEPGILTLDDLYVHFLGGNINGSGKYTFNRNHRNEIQLTATEIDLDQLTKTIGQSGSSYEGKADAKFFLSFTKTSLIKWDIDANIQIQNMKYNSKPIRDFTGQFHMRNGNATLSVNHNDVTAKAESKFTGEKIKGDFNLQILQLQPIAEMFDIHELHGKLSAKGHFGGTLPSPEIAVDFLAEDLLFQNFPMDTCSGRLQVRNNEAVVQSCRFSGRMVSADSLRSPFHLKDLRGILAYTGHMHGSVQNPEMDLSIALRNLSYRTVQIDTGNVLLNVFDHRFKLNRLELESDSLLLAARGEYALSKARGQLFVRLFKNGTRVDHAGLCPIMDSQSVFSEQFQETHSGLVRIEMAFVDAANVHLTASGDQIDLELIGRLFQRTRTIAGQLQFRSEFHGSVIHPFADLEYSLHDLKYKESRLNLLTCAIQVVDSCVSIKNMELLHGNQRSKLKASVILDKLESGKWGVTDTSRIQGSSRGANMDLRLINPLLPSGLQVSGFLNHHLKWSGIAGKPLLRGTIQVTEGELKPSADAAPIQSIMANILIKDTLFQIVPFSGVIQQVPFRLEGNIATREFKKSEVWMRLFVSDQEALAIQGVMDSDSLHLNSQIKDFNLALFQPMLPDIENLQGSLQAQLDLRGPQTDPRFTGSIYAGQCAFKIPQNDLSVTQGEVRLIFHGQSIQLDTLSLIEGQGFVSSRGWATYSKKEIENMQVEFSINDIQMRKPKDWILKIDSSRIKVEKRRNEITLSGDIVLGETRLIKNVQPRTLLAAIEKKKRPVRAVPVSYSQIRLNIRLHESDAIWVDNNLARLRFHSELALSGSAVRPILSGRLSAKEGYVLYLDRKFKIERGILDFVDPNRINPIVELSAVSDIRAYQTRSRIPYTVRLKINGLVDEAVVELTSEPPLDRPDIVTLLTVGATREEIAGKYEDGKEVTLTDVLRERASELSTRRISGYAARKVGNLLGLNEMTIEGNLFRFGRTWGPQLVASKKLTSRMELSYSTAAGNTNEQNIRLDYKLSDYFSLEGQTDQKGQSGIDLKYRLKFK